MDGPQSMNETTDAAAILAPLWRRKWLILAVALLVGVGTYLYYKRVTPTYQSVTQIYLGAGAEEQPGAERGSRKALSANAGNQAALINSIVVPEVRQRLRKAHNPAARGKAKAKAAEKSEFIMITGEAHKGRSSALLVNEIARTYVKRQHAAHERVLLTQIAIARRQLRRIEAAGTKPTRSGTTGKASEPTTSPGNVLQAANLNSKINQLETQLSVSGAQQVNPAKPRAAQLLSPKPRQNAIFGFVIGLALAAAAAYLLGRFDRRLRTLGSLESLFATQVLTALPRVRAPLVLRDARPAPSRRLIEPLRRLHTTLRLGGALGRNGEAAPRTLLFLSPDPGDGKSTLAATLALVQRDAGERVVVLDANLRRPVQARLLNVSGPHVLADVLAGTVAVEDAMQPVGASLADHDGVGPAPAGVATMVQHKSVGSLALVAGRPDGQAAPALLAHDAVGEVLGSLADDHDYVLVDASSPLEVSDVMPLLGEVEGIVIVVRIGHTRETSAERLVQLLAHTPSAPVLGVVANCAAEKDIERYGFSPSPRGRPWLRKSTRR
jgi:Mrp family chromosome partitioning ATPase/capsular polysaccharide biosynthesis protein